MKISFSELSNSAALPKAETLIFAVGDDKKFPERLQKLDKSAGGLITRALGASKFAGKKGQTLNVAVPAALPCSRVVLLGIGKLKDTKPLTFQSAGGALVPHLNAHGAKSATFIAELPKGTATPVADAAAYLAFGALLRSYRFDKYRTKEKAEDKPTFAQLSVYAAQSKQVVARFDRLEPVAEGVFFTRNLVTEPGNVIYPETLAANCKQLSKLGVDVDVLGETELRKLGMGALLGVGQGSIRDTKVVVMQWNGTDKKTKAAPLAFVGKGVTFDTGGIDIKPSNGMWEMKFDMAGAGAVIGLMHTLAARKAKVNVVGVVGLVENMPDGGAQRQGDVVKSMSGQTIEILNTDAEGRLVLSDVLWYTQERFKPKLVVDLATLTGAVIVALGSSRAGMFANDDKLAKQLSDAGEATGEEVWRLPLGDVYDKQINSDIADMQNIGADREAGSIMGAVFLQRFIKEGTPWSHLDIAGTAWTKRDQDVCPKGATAYGVRLLDRFVEDNYED